MDFRKLRLRCEARIEQLDLPVPFNARVFCSMLAAKRDRPIVLRPVTSTAGPWGLWVALPGTDLIFFEQATTPLHQEHIILHELCHLVCDHRAPTVAPAEVHQLLFPDLQSETIERVLRRAGYNVEEEREAEMLASLILERVPLADSHDESPPSPEDADLLERLASALETTWEEHN